MEVNNDDYLIVDFDKYCPKCKHESKGMFDKPCFGCLGEPVNLHSHKPVKFEEKEKKGSSK